MESHRHLMDHRCDKCLRWFWTKQKLGKHAVHCRSNNERIICQYCGMIFKNLPAHNTHTCDSANKPILPLVPSTKVMFVNLNMSKSNSAKSRKAKPALSSKSASEPNPDDPSAAETKNGKEEGALDNDRHGLWECQECLAIFKNQLEFVAHMVSENISHLLFLTFCKLY